MWTIDDKTIKARQLSVIWQWLGFTAACRWGKLYYSPDDGFDDKLKRHELAHQRQQLKQHRYIIFGYPIFCFKYAREWVKLLFQKGKKPYNDNPFEKEADFWQNTYQGWMNITKNSYKKYIK
jgi:hypothetical protein